MASVGTRFWFALCCLLLLPVRAHALTIEQNSDSSTRTLSDYIKDYVDVPNGAIDWKTFGTTKSKTIDGKTKDGYDFEYFQPSFSPAVKALNGKQITIKGFMFPLGEVEHQKLFLFGPFPLSCPFHYHVEPSLVIEVHADKTPVKFSYDAVTISGTLELVDKDTENSTFYRLNDAHIVKE